MIAGVTLALGLLKASTILHRDMLKRIMRAPSWFFDTTPTGRIVNRFAKDVDACDLLLPDSLRDLLVCTYTVSIIENVKSIELIRFFRAKDANLLVFRRYSQLLA